MTPPKELRAYHDGALGLYQEWVTTGVAVDDSAANRAVVEAGLKLSPQAFETLHRTGCIGM